MVIKAFLEGDRAVFESVCDEQPQTILNASLKERKFKGVTWDTQILDIRNVNFNRVGFPFLSSFQWSGCSRLRFFFFFNSLS